MIHRNQRMQFAKIYFIIYC